MFIRPDETIYKYTERIALRMATPAGILLAFLIVLANLDRNPIPLTGDTRAFGAIFFYWLVPAAQLAGGTAHILGINAWNARVSKQRQRTWMQGIVPITLAYTVLLVSVGIGALQVIETGFRQLMLDKIQAAIIVGAAGAAMLQWMIKQIMRLTVNKLLQLTAIIITGGVYLAAANIDDPRWWQVSFSHLGTVESNANMIFNSTLIFAGILLIVWLPYLMNDLKILVRHTRTTARSARNLQRLLFLLGVSIALIGLFEHGTTPLSTMLHRIAAYTVAAIFTILMIFVKKLTPGLPPEVFATSWMLVVALIASILMGVIGYFNTVGFEIITFVLGIAWLQFFTRNVRVTGAELEPGAYPS